MNQAKSATETKKAIIEKLVKQNIATLRFDCISLCCVGC